jgi:hypothetical protein
MSGKTTFGGGEMEAERSRRLRAGAALARNLGKSEIRKSFATNGYDSGQEIIVVLDSDRVGDVFERVSGYSPPVTVAIYFEATKTMKFVTLEPGMLKDPPMEQIGANSTIGMLYEYLERLKRRSTSVRLTEWASVRISEFADLG